MSTPEILIIDDDEINNFVLKNVILRAFSDALVHIASEGQEGLDFLANRRSEGTDPPGIILVDINMPVLNGFEFLDAYQERFVNKHSHVYMVSSSISKEDQKRSYSYDFVQGYITKPLVNQNVVFIVDEYLQTRQT